MKNENQSIKIAIAGATGFIGRNLINEIDKKYVLKCLSRTPAPSQLNSPNIQWVETDLFSYTSVNSALKDADIAIYLVHSMLPSTRLFQGNFQDTDLFIADNFARACINNNVKQIIYLGGLIPEGKISPHLESRKEVEDVFKSTGITTSIFRAGMVVGNGGSSYEILKNLVLNLPAMVLPKWAKSNTQIIYIDDLVKIIARSINNSTFFNKTIDVVNGENITYENLIRETATFLNKPTHFFSVPIHSISFSKLWVSVFGNSEYELVSPLVDSLLCNLPHPEVQNEIKDLIEHKKYSDMLKKIHLEKTTKKKKLLNRKDSNTVRSIQRLKNGQQLDVDTICDLYVTWLPTHLKDLIRVETSEDKIFFYSIFIKEPLLILHFQQNHKGLNRIKFHITGGLLSKTNDTGWLEFRTVCGGQFTLASINNFVPSLPWYIYKYTQALAHLKVMHDFSKFLESKPHS